MALERPAVVAAVSYRRKQRIVEGTEETHGEKR